MVTYRKRANPIKLEYARRMRRQPTKSERLLWSKLKGKQIGHKFRRQSIILGWIVDFYCPSLKLVIEVDGSIHDTKKQKAKDRQRQEAIEAKGFRFLRFTNSQVNTDIDRVVSAIAQSCEGVGGYNNLLIAY